MARLENATPLIALDAVVIDTETTSLDPRKARAVEIGAVRLRGGRLDASSQRRWLIQPGEPIPPAASRIHGIDDAVVAAAPPFGAVWREFAAYVNDGLVIGHSIGFDLAVLRHECERAGVAWTRPRGLDTRLLGEIVAPELADYSLDGLAAWLGVEIVDRHSALNDALAAARIFLALLPKLREAGIRTLAEAERACGALTDVLVQRHQAGWIEAAGAPERADPEAGSRAIDTYPYRHRIKEVMSAPPRFAPPDLPLGAALQRMASEGVSSLFIHPHANGPALPEDTGIVTERDVLRALARSGGDALTSPVTQIANKPLVTVPADALGFLAMARMNRYRIRHLGVTDESGYVCGALSARDLLRLRAEGAVLLEDEIDQAKDVKDLAAAWAKLPRVVAGLVREEMSGRQVAAVVSRRLGGISRGACILAERRMQDSGRGPPPCPYVFAVLGSAGRDESLLALDQDNALIFEDGAPGGGEDRWFADFAALVADTLHEVGVPYCKGGVMAKNPHWRGSARTWQERIDHWIGRSNPADLLSIDIFFDLRGVHGAAGLATAIWRHGFDAAKGNAVFAKLLVDAAGAVQPGLTFFGRIRTENGRIDLKKAGLFGIVTAARALAICHHVVERSTPERLAGIKERHIGGEHDLDGLAEAQGIFLDRIVAQQIEDLDQGVPLSNRVAVKSLTRRDRDRLVAALQAVRHLEEVTRDLLF